MKVVDAYVNVDELVPLTFNVEVVDEYAGPSNILCPNKLLISSVFFFFSFLFFFGLR